MNGHMYTHCSNQTEANVFLCLFNQPPLHFLINLLVEIHLSYIYIETIIIF